MREKLFTTREVSHILGIPEKDVIGLADKNLVPHFKVAGEFLRFKKEDILRIKPVVEKKYNIPERQMSIAQNRFPLFGPSKRDIPFFHIFPYGGSADAYTPPRLGLVPVAFTKDLHEGIAGQLVP